MSNLLFIRTELAIEGMAPTVHIAELEEISPAPSSQAKLLRIIEMTGTDTGEEVTGAGIIWNNENPTTPAKAVNLAAPPDSIVPHPDSYQDLPDITVTFLSNDEFNSLWQDALNKFPELS